VQKRIAPSKAEEKRGRGEKEKVRSHPISDFEFRISDFPPIPLFSSSPLLLLSSSPFPLFPVSPFHAAVDLRRDTG
jgi:hypothetical protein